MSCRAFLLSMLISTHALREEGDPTGWSHPASCRYFYPRPPRGGRQMDAVRAAIRTAISTHALREEGDVQVPVLGR